MLKLSTNRRNRLEKTLGEKIITPAKESVSSLLELYGGGRKSVLLLNLKEDIQVGAEDIEKENPKRCGKGGFRTAGDVA